MVSAYSYLYPIGDSYLELSDFFIYIQAYALARMIEESAPRCSVRLGAGDLELGINMHPQSTVRTVEWSIVYYVAGYILQWVRRGIGGHGALYFTHPSGIWLSIVIQDAGSLGRLGNAVLPDIGCSSSGIKRKPP